MVARFDLRVNGATHRVEAPPEMPLLWVLRDLLGLTGSKYGCGRGLCGACTVHLDGHPVRSCVTPLSGVGQAEVTTIEGLSGEVAEALRSAWRETAVPQCGYCQPGQLMSAAALLVDDPEPAEEAIKNALRGNLCRCGTYGRIRRAVGAAAERLRGSE